MSVCILEVMIKESRCPKRMLIFSREVTRCAQGSHTLLREDVPRLIISNAPGSTIAATRGRLDGTTAATGASLTWRVQASCCHIAAEGVTSTAETEITTADVQGTAGFTVGRKFATRCLGVAVGNTRLRRRGRAVLGAKATMTYKVY
jgi:hypothetical protein